MNIPRLIQQNFDRLQENHRKEMNESLDAHANYIQSMRSDLDTANHEIEVLRLAIKIPTVTIADMRLLLNAPVSNWQRRKTMTLNKDATMDAIRKVLQSRDEHICTLFRKLVAGGSFYLVEQRNSEFETIWHFEYSKDDDGATHAVSILLTENQALKDRCDELEAELKEHFAALMQWCKDSFDMGAEGMTLKDLYDLSIEEAREQLAKDGAQDGK